MEQYFVTHSSARQKALSTAGVPFSHFMIKGEKGLLIEDSVLQNALSSMRLDIERTRPSSYEGVKILYVKKLARNQAARPVARPAPSEITAEVVVTSWENDEARRSQPDFVAVAKEFSTAFGVKKIVLKSCRNGNMPETPLEGTGNLNIFFWSAPSGRSLDNTRRNPSPTHLFGYKISDEPKWRFWLPSNIGTVISDEAGVKVAELVGENLYILHAIDNHEIERASRRGIFYRLLEEVAARKNLSPEELEKRRAEMIRQEKLRLEAEVRANPVKIGYWSSAGVYKQKFVEVALEFLAPLGGKQIILNDLTTSYGTNRAPRSDGKFYITLGAAPAEFEYAGEMGTTLFGAKLTFSREADSSTHKAAPFDSSFELADGAGISVGCLVGDNLYITYPLVREYLRLQWDGKGPEALFRRILEEAVFYRTATDEQKAAKAREAGLRFRAQSRAAYVEMCRGRVSAEIASAEAIIANTPQKVIEYQKAVVGLIRDVARARERIVEIASMTGKAAEKYAAEFDKLVTIEKVRDVRIVNGKMLQVFTDTLYCVDPRTKKTHEIGHFRIDIHFAGEVRWYNLARKVNGFETNMNAPHVYDSGRACLGSMAEIIPDLIATYEFAALAMVSISFIESVNVKDAAGQTVDRWPLAANQPT